MGGRLSTRSNSSSTSSAGAPHLPLDIHLEILSHLTPDQDQQTLMSAALCCTALRNASQQILFSSMRRRWMYHPDEQSIVIAHINFLQTIVNSPDHLALFVRSYSQIGLSLEPSYLSSRQTQYLEIKTHRVKLWDLTVQALPLMINLKTLYFEPSSSHASAPTLLQNCTFQLGSFTWIGEGSEEWLFDQFLTSQPSLLHLQIKSTNYHDDEKHLPDNVCPALVSVACTFSGFAKVAKNRPITAFHMVTSALGIEHPVHIEKKSPGERQQYLIALDRLKYLHLSSLFDFQPFASEISLDNVIVVELGIWRELVISEETNILATQFPQLRVLRLWDNYSWSSAPHSLVRDKVATEAFAKCRELETVMFSKRTNNRLTWVIKKQQGADVEEPMTDVHVLDI
ncbi:hypothetical protein D9619_011073 [Psilocybe cf. subviscida]|uniref:F-box domain-containing protein n=1 Tax=Psilocybe cf. subviscida TaxID=2480587 RepID=A0A8H5EZW1_9AGAR|nr:hypothetical protein D9619_011073 [Psilocybe cf. subviscida]